MPAFNEIIGQSKQFWISRTNAQKALLVASAAGTALLLGLFAHLLSTPDYKPLFTGLEPADAQALTAQLDSQGIPHQSSADGKTISVPAEKLDVARLQTASQGTPHSGRMGFELFDKASWGQTEFDEKVAYQRALEGELERTIGTLAEVESARVHLVMPADSVFLDRERPAKASVILKLRRDRLSRESVLAISRLVAGAVDELKPEDVSIIDAQSSRAFSIAQDNGTGGEALEADLKQRLVSTLEPIVGPDSVRASVNIEYDQSTTEENEEKYDPSISAVLSQQKTEDAAGDVTAPGGIPGTGSNTPSKKPNPPTASGAGMQRSTSESAVYGVNKIQIHRTVPAGKVQRITTAILVNDGTARKVVNGKEAVVKVKRSPEELDKIQQLAQAAIGFDSKRGDVITVQNMSFDTTGDLPESARPTWSENVRNAVADYGSLIRPVSLLVLFLLAYLFVVRPVQKRAFAPGLVLQSEQVALAASDGEHLLDPSSQGNGFRKAAQLKQQTAELVKANPADTARALQAWLGEDLS